MFLIRKNVENFQTFIFTVSMSIHLCLDMFLNTFFLQSVMESKRIIAQEIRQTHELGKKNEDNWQKILILCEVDSAIGRDDKVKTEWFQELFLLISNVEIDLIFYLKYFTLNKTKISKKISKHIYRPQKRIPSKVILKRKLSTTSLSWFGGRRVNHVGKWAQEKRNRVDGRKDIQKSIHSMKNDLRFWWKKTPVWSKCLTIGGIFVFYLLISLWYLLQLNEHKK